VPSADSTAFFSYINKLTVVIVNVQTIPRCCPHRSITDCGLNRAINNEKFFFTKIE
jgi:hypothetical protein